MWKPPKLIASALTWRGWNPRVIHVASRWHTALLRRFRRTKLIGDDTLILTTRGRRSGKATSTPLFYASEADRLLVAASFAGSGTPPDWYLNLAAHPEVRVTIDGQTAHYRARTLTGPEASAAWP